MPITGYSPIQLPANPTGKVLSDYGTWIVPSGGGGESVFESDQYGDLQPSETVSSDEYFETDANGDLMPME